MSRFKEKALSHLKKNERFLMSEQVNEDALYSIFAPLESLDDRVTKTYHLEGEDLFQGTEITELEYKTYNCNQRNFLRDILSQYGRSRVFNHQIEGGLNCPTVLIKYGVEVLDTIMRINPESLVNYCGSYILYCVN